MDRRQVLKQIALFIAYIMGSAGISQRRLVAQSDNTESDAAEPLQANWTVRPVQAGDESALINVMRASVAGDRAFNGRCAPLEWTNEWAEWVIAAHPASLVMAWNEEVIAFLDLPSRKPQDPNPDVERNQQAFWCAAGGVRSDLLSPDVALSVFLQLLYHTFVQARELGFKYVRCAAPWEKHPSLRAPFADYPGLTITPFTSDEGELRYLIEWRLQDAISALVTDGATASLPRVQLAEAISAGIGA